MKNKLSRLKLARLKMGMNQTQLSFLVGASQMSVSRWERGKLEPQKKYKKRLAAALGEDLKTLFPGADNE